MVGSASLADRPCALRSAGHYRASDGQSGDRPATSCRAGTHELDGYRQARLLEAHLRLAVWYEASWPTQAAGNAVGQTVRHRPVARVVKLVLAAGGRSWSACLALEQRKSKLCRSPLVQCTAGTHTMKQVDRCRRSQTAADGHGVDKHRSALGSRLHACLTASGIVCGCDRSCHTADGLIARAPLPLYQVAPEHRRTASEYESCGVESRTSVGGLSCFSNQPPPPWNCGIVKWTEPAGTQGVGR